jgi:hypothetical protein
LQSTIGRKNQIENGRIEKKITFASLPVCIEIGIGRKSLRQKHSQMKRKTIMPNTFYCTALTLISVGPFRCMRPSTMRMRTNSDTAQRH